MAAEAARNGAGGAGQPVTVKVWDVLVRMMHWGLVAAFAVSHLSADESEHHGEHDSGPLEAAPLHELAGYVILGIVVVRIVWGLFGTKHARFTDFIYRPGTVFGFLRKTLQFRAPRYIGHNPAGGAMVVVLLCTLLAIGGTGLLMTTYTELRWLKDVHEVLANFSLVLVALHVAGVIAASIEHRESLVTAMFTGRKRVDPSTDA
jgi:cytochrome b